MDFFLVESPTQVLNALEARHRFCCDSCHLCVLLTGLFERSRYDRLIRTSDWTSVTFIDFHFVARDYDFGTNPPSNFWERLIEIGTVLDLFRKRAQINRLARRRVGINRLFLGQYRLDTRHYFRHFANASCYEELFLLDDGTDTLLINEQRRMEDSLSAMNCKEKENSSFKSRIKDKFGKWNVAGATSLTFFSCVDIDVNERDRVIRNDYNYLRSLAHGSDAHDGRVFFLGQPLVDDGYVALQNYLEMLEIIKGQLGQREFIYVAHSREAQRYLEEIERNLIVQTRRFDVPIEFEMTVGGNCPEILAGFFCSALENCSVIFGNEIKILSYEIDSSLLLSYHDEVAHIYRHLKKARNVTVANL